MKRENILHQSIRPEPSPSVAAVQIERRSHTRFPVSISAEVTELESRAVIIGRATDLGIGGCYVDSMNPFPRGTRVGV